jgi:hypothetical protein
MKYPDCARVLGMSAALAALSSVVGCSTSHTSSPAPAATRTEDVEVTYAAGLEEAFEIYSDEVYSAALFDYGSVAEADAVVRTLSERHFDQLLESSLSKRGLSTRGLARFAEEHATFFHEQQRRHWGKLQELEATLASIPLKVRPGPIDESLAAF